MSSIPDSLGNLGSAIGNFLDPHITLLEFLPGPLWAPIQPVVVNYHLGLFGGGVSGGGLLAGNTYSGKYSSTTLNIGGIELGPFIPSIDIYPSAYRSPVTLAKTLVHEHAHYFWSLQPQLLQDASELAVNAAKDIPFPGKSLYNAYHDHVAGKYTDGAPTGNETFAYWISDLLVPDPWNDLANAFHISGVDGGTGGSVNGIQADVKGIGHTLGAGVDLTKDAVDTVAAIGSLSAGAGGVLGALGSVLGGAVGAGATDLSGAVAALSGAAGVGAAGLTGVTGALGSLASALGVSGAAATGVSLLIDGIAGIAALGSGAGDNQQPSPVQEVSALLAASLG